MVAAELYSRFHVFFMLQVDSDTYDTNEMYKKLREDRGYSYSDMLTVSPEKLPNYDQKVCG